jgi:hypothetical protein
VIEQKTTTAKRRASYTIFLLQYRALACHLPTAHSRDSSLWLYMVGCGGEGGLNQWFPGQNIPTTARPTPHHRWFQEEWEVGAAGVPNRTYNTPKDRRPYVAYRSPKCKKGEPLLVTKYSMRLTIYRSRE